MLSSWSLTMLLLQLLLLLLFFYSLIWHVWEWKRECSFSHQSMHSMYVCVCDVQFVYLLFNSSQHWRFVFGNMKLSRQRPPPLPLLPSPLPPPQLLLAIQLFMSMNATIRGIYAVLTASSHQTEYPFAQ